MACPTAAHESDFVILDNFERNQKTAWGSSARGSPYLHITSDSPHSSIRRAVVSDGRLIAPPLGKEQSKIATYTGVDVGRLPHGVEAGVIFGPGAPGGAVALISTSAGVRSLRDITGWHGDGASGSVHMVFTDTVTLVQYFDCGKLITVKEMKYERLPRRHRGYHIGWSYAGNGLFQVYLPNGRVEEFINSDMATKLGRFVVFEHYYKRGQAETMMDWIGVR